MIDHESVHLPTKYQPTYQSPTREEDFYLAPALRAPSLVLLLSPTTLYNDKIFSIIKLIQSSVYLLNKNNVASINCVFVCLKLGGINPRIVQIQHRTSTTILHALPANYAQIRLAFERRPRRKRQKLANC